LPKFVSIADVDALGEVAGRYSIKTVVDNADRVDHRSGDRMSQDQRKREACERNGSDKQLRSNVGLLVRIDAGHHVRFSPVDQLIGQSLEPVRERPELRTLTLFSLGRSPVAEELDDV